MKGEYLLLQSVVESYSIELLENWFEVLEYFNFLLPYTFTPLQFWANIVLSVT